MSINKVILVGNVGKDPVVRYFDKGVAKATFPLATSETYTNQQGETITSTEWHNIVLWRALAEVAEKTIKKGSQVYIVGKIKTRTYVDKDGVNKYITEILADTLLPLEKKQASSGTGSFQGTAVRETQGKGASTVNEPATGYQASADLPGDDLIPGNSQNEDDLPF
ncbi:MAG: single-stranded DNA-binding protein [Chloroflexota bacterium]